MEKILVDWDKSALYSECTWHQLSPYIGRMKSTMAASLLRQFTKLGDTVYDPFCGAGTVALEAWIAGRNVIAGDLSPYGCILTQGKVHPPTDLRNATAHLDQAYTEAKVGLRDIDLRHVPQWVRGFFHTETLREIIALRNVLIHRKQWFLLSCLLGILHHWRPGFLSYPCSHTVPFLQNKLYPREQCPELYAYKEVYPRFAAKVKRAFARTKDVDRHLTRTIKQADAMKPTRLVKEGVISALVTSPPYMNSLSYARDNRLRLWFLGVEDYRTLEPILSPGKQAFLAMMSSLLPQWSALLPEKAPCVLVLGAVQRDGRNHDLPDAVMDMVQHSSCGFRLSGISRSLIPDGRRARGKCRSIREDTILLLRKRSQ